MELEANNSDEEEIPSFQQPASSKSNSPNSFEGNQISEDEDMLWELGM